MNTLLLKFNIIFSRYYLMVFLIPIQQTAFADKPDWLDMASQDNKDYHIIGSAMPQTLGPTAQYKLAQMSAKQIFAENKVVFIHSIQQNMSHQNETIFTSQSSIRVNTTIDFSQFTEKDSWQDPKSGELFLLFVLK